MFLSSDPDGKALATGEAAGDGPRFEFGANWKRFLDTIDDERIEAAEHSLQEMLGVRTLKGRSFVDVGSGSGLFSLAARRLGADVLSFDFDPEAVACCVELKRRSAPNDEHWRIECGSILDPAYVRSLGRFDVVYAWGVLHHTGRMWEALQATADLVGERGVLFVALYNDQGLRSRGWREIKRVYNRLPRMIRPVFSAFVLLGLESLQAVRAVAKGRSPSGFGRWRKARRRGMHPWYDWRDWVGGYPYEVAPPQRVEEFVGGMGFDLISRTTTKSYGCNEFVFRKTDPVE